MADMKIKTYSDLDKNDLYDILALRQMVFVVEQNCPYLDADGKDQESWHLMLKEKEKIVAYARLIPRDLSYQDYTSIGRILVHPDARSKGLGKILTEQSIQFLLENDPDSPIKISAQLYLKEFYSELGFEAFGVSYLEDGIPHIAMIYKR